MRLLNFGDTADSVTVKCYGKEEIFKTRKEAENQYLEFMLMSDGSERDRYTEIYLQIKAGFRLCTDEVD